MLIRLTKFWVTIIIAVSAATMHVTIGSTQETKTPSIADQNQSKSEQKKPEFELAEDVDGLFDQLKRARDRKRAERISQRIWLHWQTSDSRSIDLLTNWARSATGKKDFAAALDLLDQVVVLRPDYAEGWNQRATLHYIMQNYSKSIADIERTLVLEPRHYGALAGLATIQQNIGDKKSALSTWHKVLSIYPAMKNGQDSVIKLEEALSGSGI